MNSHSNKLVVGFAFLLALAGGGAAGILASRHFASPARSVVVPAGVSLSEQLQLSSDQSERMRHIWERMRDVSDDCYKQAQRLEQQRDNDYTQLLTDEQKKQYQKLHQEYVDRYTAITAKRQAAFDQSVSETKNLLNDSQRQRYEAILSKRFNGGEGGGGAAPDRSTRQNSPSLSSSKPLASPG